MTQKFDKVYCSQCGGEFGPGDHGYSHCLDHIQMQTIPRGDPATQPGTWAPPANPQLTGLYLVSCPKCGKQASLNTRNVHTVEDDGKVIPSWVCPYPPCEFHEWVQLGGWVPAEAKL